MTHKPADCDHVWSAWTTAERLNEAGERCFYFQRTCFQCPMVGEQVGAIVEEVPERFYAKTQEVPSEPDD